MTTITSVKNKVKNKKRLSLIFYTLSGIIYMGLLLESIFTLSGICILNERSSNWLYNFFYEAGAIFRAKPMLVPVSFIMFFVVYIIMGLSTYCSRIRNKTLATIALGFLMFSLVIILYTFWEIISKYIFTLFIFTASIICLLLAYFFAPWREWICERIYSRLCQIEAIVNRYQRVLNEFALHGYDQKALNKLNDAIKNYTNKIENFKKRIFDQSEDLNLLELEIDVDRLYNTVKAFKDIYDEGDVISSIENLVADELKKYLNDNRLTAMCLFELSDKDIKTITKLMEE